MKHFSRLMRDETGSIMMIAAFGLLVLIGILALSVDHGRNYLTQSDMEAKLTSLAKAAGSEYTYWEIRQEITRTAKQQGLPAVKDEDCNVYVLCSSAPSNSASNVLPNDVHDKLENFVNTELNKRITCTTPPCVTVTLDKKIHVNSSKSYPARFLYFTAVGTQQQNFSATPIAANSKPPAINVNSGVLINSFDSRGIASHIVFSLDADSKNQFGGTPDPLQQVMGLVQSTITAQAFNTPDLRVGLTLGNVPVRGPLTNGTLTPGGLDCNASDKLGHSGGCADNAPQFSGKDVGTMRVAVQSRKYSYMGNFTASDAMVCANPVWTYRSVVADKTCNTPAEAVENDSAMGSCPPRDTTVTPGGVTPSTDQPNIGGYPPNPPEDCKKNGTCPPPPPPPCKVCTNTHKYINGHH